MKRALLLTIALSAIVFAQWRQVNLSPIHTQFNDVPQFTAFANESLGYIAGSGGAVYRTTDRGYNWTRLSQILSSTQKSIICFSDSIVVTVGFAGTIQRSTNAGATWVQVTSGTTANFLAAAKVSSQIGIAVGLTGVVAKTTDAGVTWTKTTEAVGKDFSGINFVTPTVGFIGSSAGTFLKTTNAGVSWSILNTLPANTNIVFGFSFTDTLNGFAIGSKTGTVSAVPQLWKTTNGGTNWTEASSFTDVGEFYSLQRLTATRFLVIGSRGLSFLSTDAGTTWNKINNPIGGTDANHFINGSAVVSAGRIILVGYFNNTPNTAYYVLTSQDNGSTWKTQYNLTSDWIRDVYYPAGNKIYLAGNNGGIWCSYNGGGRWYKQTTGTTSPLYAIHGTDTTTAYSVSNAGLALKTTNGGITWTTLTTGVTRDLNAVWFINPQLGYIAGSGGTIRKTTDGGTTWLTQTSPYPAGVSAIHFVNASVGFMVGSGGMVIRTIDSGTTWLRVNAPTQYKFSSVYGFSAAKFIAVSDSGKVFSTTDSGATFTITTLGKLTLNKVRFSNNQLGIIAADSGKHFTTTDGGTTWNAGASLNHTQGYLGLANLQGTDAWYMSGASGVLYSTDNNAGLTGVEDFTEDLLPRSNVLEQNYPNPFNPSTTISFSLNEPAFARLSIFTVTGKEVAVLHNGETKEGKYSYRFTPSAELPSGVYFYRISVTLKQNGKSFVNAGKMLYLK